MMFKNVQDVVRWRLCIGCGACYSICPNQKIKLVDVTNDGIRPSIQKNNGSRGEGVCEDCRICLEACPGIYLSTKEFIFDGSDDGVKVSRRWGRYYDIWEAYASDPEIRLKGASGGLCTVLALYCMKEGIAGQTLHIGYDPDFPWRNKTFLSKTREELLSRCGSRYAPASPCDSLRKIEEAKEPSVFIGKPCDVAGLRMVQRMRPVIKEKTALVIGFFCAGTPSTKGTLDLLRKHGIEPNEISEFKYRGEGWLGMATALLKSSGQECLRLTYGESWGFLQKYRPFRCYFCPDLTSEFADISVGDPWYREVGHDEPGRSLVIVRTKRGREIFYQAVKDGYICADRADEEILFRSQKNLLGKRKAIWGRLLAMKIFGIPVPRYEGFFLFKNWVELPLAEKALSFFGTIRRIIQRKYYKPFRYHLRMKQ